ncbi:hypothetical protein [Mesorhizobium amorphae]|uniref:hypothetical protein n=1 Tax=Mesorhizobium amorphae TaxID=71433 RepID=UPI000B68217A|nr:hypothetical protein [Mesorhizobium amorphae]OWK21720.1 hypothetical protein AJ88_19025 [Mesorhizobium amorphae CCBAU 01583]
MIDLDSVEEADDGDGESVHVYGLDPVDGKWKWEWVTAAELCEAGRFDLVEMFWPSRNEEAA